MDKKITFAILLAVVAVALYIGFAPSQKDAITLIVDFGDGTKKSFYNHSDSAKSAWSLLQQAAAISNLDLEVLKDFYPKKIDGFSNGKDDKAWNLYVNDAKQNSSPISVTVVPPDRVVFKFE